MSIRQVTISYQTKHQALDTKMKKKAKKKCSVNIKNFKIPLNPCEVNIKNFNIPLNPCEVKLKKIPIPKHFSRFGTINIYIYIYI